MPKPQLLSHDDQRGLPMRFIAEMPDMSQTYFTRIREEPSPSFMQILQCVPSHSGHLALPGDSAHKSLRVLCTKNVQIRIEGQRTPAAMSISSNGSMPWVVGNPATHISQMMPRSNRANISYAPVGSEADLVR
jgi:hypothetical protein